MEFGNEACSCFRRVTYFPFPSAINNVHHMKQSAATLAWLRAVEMCWIFSSDSTDQNSENQHVDDDANNNEMMFIVLLCVLVITRFH